MLKSARYVAMYYLLVRGTNERYEVGMPMKGIIWALEEPLGQLLVRVIV